MQIIVRADFYPDGSIVPIGITYPNGHSVFIDSFDAIYKNIAHGRKVVHSFSCYSGKTKFFLTFSDNRWAVTLSKDCWNGLDEPQNPRSFTP